MALERLKVAVRGTLLAAGCWGALLSNCTAFVKVPGGHVHVNEDGVLVDLPAVFVNVTDERVFVDVPFVEVTVHGDFQHGRGGGF